MRRAPTNAPDRVPALFLLLGLVLVLVLAPLATAITLRGAMGPRSTPSSTRR